MQKSRWIGTINLVYRRTKCLSRFENVLFPRFYSIIKPRKRNATGSAIIISIFDTKQLLKGKNVDSLISLPIKPATKRGNREQRKMRRRKTDYLWLFGQSWVTFFLRLFFLSSYFFIANNFWLNFYTSCQYQFVPENMERCISFYTFVLFFSSIFSFFFAD